MLVQNKGAVLILVLNALVYTATGGIGSIISLFVEQFSYSAEEHKIGLSLLLCVLLLLQAGVYPIAGYIADVHCGRYRVLKVCMWGMWFTMIMLTGSLVLLHYYRQRSTVHVIVMYIIVPVLLFLMSVLQPGFMANILPFMLDNLLSKSSTVLQKYIFLYTWTFSFGMKTLTRILQCPFLDSSDRALMEGFTLTLCLTTAVSIEMYFRNHLNMFFKPKNPYKQVIQVLWFAMKNKRPLARSAFTYWEDQIPSRVDLAKSKYGGPFTDEEVDDVKTLGRLCLFMPALTLWPVILYGYLILIQSLKIKPNFVHSDSVVCSGQYQVYNAVLTFGIPAYLVFFQPQTRRFFQWRFGTMKRMAIGLVAAILAAASTIALYAAINEPADCSSWIVLHHRIAQYCSLIPTVLIGFTYILAVPAFNEFICAQCPYHMQATLIGLGFTTQVMGQLMAMVLTMVVSRVPLTSPINCYTVHASVLTACVVITIFIFAVFFRKYRKRERGENVSIFRFVDEFYSKVVENDPKEEEEEPVSSLNTSYDQSAFGLECNLVQIDSPY